MSKETNKCQWCGSKTNMPWSYYAMSPLIPKMEERIQEVKGKHGDDWWKGLEKENPKLMDELSFYDQSICTVGKGFVCAKCLDKDATNYKKYRHEEIIK